MNRLNDTTCDMLTSYLLGELTDAEASIFNRHLDACKRCKAELEELNDINDTFVAIGDDNLMNLPSELKAKTLHKAFARRPPVTPRNQRIRWSRSRFQLIFAVTAIFLLGLVLGRMSNIMQSQSTEVATVPKMLNTIRLLPTDDTHAAGTAMVFRQNKTISLVVNVQHMQPLSAYDCYSVWETVNGQPHNLGDFTVDKNGSAVISVPVLNPISTIRITLEPAWSDPTPRGPDILIPAVQKS